MDNKFINIDNLKYYNDKIDQIKQNTLVSGQNIKTLNGESILGEGDIKLENSILSLTYSELVSLRDNANLMPGQQYRITDYVTTTVQTDTQSAGHQFDIIVTADDESALNEIARAIQHDGDTYFVDSDLNAWQIWYCLDNDSERFEWADATNSKGVIYCMIDENNNYCPYDFKNIQFKHPNDKTTYPDYYYTFSTVIDGVVTDHSLLKGYCYGNTMKEYIKSINSYSEKQSLNNNIFLNKSETDSCHSNSFEYNCYKNSFEAKCYSNSFGNHCSYNSFRNYCNYNSFKNRCYYNSFGDNCGSNSFGNECKYNSFKNGCYYNSFGNSCEYNSFRNYCNYNSFKNRCYYNSFGDNCGSNSFGNSCYYNSFRVSADNAATLKGYVQYNHFDDGCSYNVICNSNTTSSSKPLKNINVNRGVSGTISSYNYINIDILNSEQEINVNQVDGIVSIGNILSIKYESLKTLRNNSKLISGRQYRIIDYVTTTTQENTQYAGHQFDIIVTALNESTLSEEAQAIQNSNDGYFDDSNLSAWKIWYCLDNDTDRFAWAGDVKVDEIEYKYYDSSECTIKSELVNGNEFITPFNFESCVWVDGDGDEIVYGHKGIINHDIDELIYEWDYFSDDTDHLCLYKSNADLYEEEGQPDYGDKYLYRGVITVDGEEYDYWQKWDEENGSITVGETGDYVYATTPRIVTNPEAFRIITETEDIYESGKGVIYRMIDEFGNDCPYDFKNIQFKRKLTDGELDTENGVDTYCYTFNAYCSEDSDIYDASVIAHKDAIEDDTNRCYGNVIKEYYNKHNDTKCLKLNNIVFLNTCNVENYKYFHCYNNSFGDSCHDNSFGDYCSSNSFGNDCYSNSFGYTCSSNSFGNNCRYNSFGNNCQSNSFGTHCYNIFFGYACSSNSFGDSCHDNSFGDICQRNSFGNDCDYNSFGNNCSFNSFGNDCLYNSFRVSADTSSLLKSYVRYNHFDDGCSYNVILNSDTTSSSIVLKNINVNRGVSGTPDSYNYINITTLNQDYEIQVAKNSSGVIKIYCEADLIA